MSTLELQDRDGPMQVSTYGLSSSQAAILFCAGRGGSPARYDTLLEHLACAGAYVVAPHFEFMVSTRVTEEILLERARRTHLAFETCLAPLGSPCFGIGHSLGGTLLLAHAGAKAWTHSGAPVPIPRLKLEGLALLAPVLDFFQPPGSLDELYDLRAGLAIWLGELDRLIAAATVDSFCHGLPAGLRVEFARVPKANHFTFMSHPPPRTVETHPDRALFLTQLGADIAGRFLREP